MVNLTRITTTRQLCTSCTGASLICLLFALMLLGKCNAREVLYKHTDIVLIGGMGDLAKKYLMKGFHDLISKHQNDTHTFAFYPSGRSIAETTEPILADIFDEKLVCGGEDNECTKRKNAFLKVTKYVKLMNSNDYDIFCSELKMNWKSHLINVSENNEVEVLFYLSIPSKGYLSTAEFINKNCRIDLKNWSLKVVLEKPFGHDRRSASKMSIELSDSFSEEEIYRVDHYLGKTISREITTFRQKNVALEALLTRDHVDHIEIFMKETIGVKGRIEFYDETGVIRDVMQNHLTELLALVTMDIPSGLGTSNIKQNKLRLLQQVLPAKKAPTLLAQYTDYMTEAERGGGAMEKTKFTPTFAATVLNINSPRWDGVPMILVAGKKLNERSSFVRVVFKRNSLCLTKCSNPLLKQLVFHIGHGALSSPAIVVSRALGKPVWPDGFRVPPTSSLPPELYDESTDQLYLAFPTADPNAYTMLIDDLYQGVQDKFVGTEHLLALWDIWSDVVTNTQKTMPLLYSESDAEGNLTFTFTNDKLKFVTITENTVEMPMDHTETRQTPTSYLGRKLITLSKEKLTYLLAKDIVDAMTAKLKMSISFHIAFSGGNSPLMLFDTLVQYFPDIPWMYVNIWQVDERCVPSTDKDSNFRYLESHLLRYINVPHFNIHPMPVDVAGKLCSPRDEAVKLYQADIKEVVGGVGFDYVVLGVGADGHTASLFPGSSQLKETTRLTVLTDHNQSPNQRMTLTLPAINTAQRISVLVVGEGKKVIIEELEDKGNSIEKYPILGVNPEHGELKWFIDEAAL